MNPNRLAALATLALTTALALSAAAATATDVTRVDRAHATIESPGPDARGVVRPWASSPSRRRTATPAKVVAPLRPAAPAVNEVMTRSWGFDRPNGDCAPRGWTAEDRTDLVFAHVDHHVANHAYFNGVANGDTTLPHAVGAGLYDVRDIAREPDGRMLVLQGADYNVVFHLPLSHPRLVEVDASGNASLFAVLPLSDFTQQPTFVYDAAHAEAIVALQTRSGIWQLLRVSRGGTPVVVAGDGGSFEDTTSAASALGAITSMALAPNGDLVFNDQSRARIRLLRQSDGRIVTLAGQNLGPPFVTDGQDATSANIPLPLGITISPAGDAVDFAAEYFGTVLRVDFATHVLATVPGLPDPRYENTSYTGITWVGGDLFLATGARIDRLHDGVVSTVVGSDEYLGPAAARDLATTYRATRPAFQFSQTLFGPIADGAGGILFGDRGKRLVLSRDSQGVLHPVAGQPLAMDMGTKALWFGADSLSAPAEVRNWAQGQGVGSGWSQRLTSPPFTVVTGDTLLFDAYVKLDDVPNDVLNEGDDDVFMIGVQALLDNGTWGFLGTEGQLPARNAFFSGRQYYGHDLVQFRTPLDQALLPGVHYASPTQIRIVVQTPYIGTNEDGELAPGVGGVILDNLWLHKLGGNVFPPVDFENGTTGVWTLSAQNAPYFYDGFAFSNFMREAPPTESQPQVQHDFDFADRTCVWTFTSPNGHVAPGVDVRLTSPWIALTDTNSRVTIRLSGKFNPVTTGRVVTPYVRWKYAGDTRPAGMADYDGNIRDLSSGDDIVATFATVDLTWPGLFNVSGSPRVDSIQVVLGIEDRPEEHRVVFEDRAQTRLPYIDDVQIIEDTPDDDDDGIADIVDACPTVSAAGRDADGDGCPDSTATLRHVESWANGDRPIHVRISPSPSITDGSDLLAIRAAFDTWRAVDGADVPLVEDPVTTQTAADPLDGVDLITFQDDLVFPPDVIAVTPTTSFTTRHAFDDRMVLPGQIVDSDLIFNTQAVFSTSTANPGGRAVDLQAVATHEVGHLLGLSHSGVTDATMFPVLQLRDEGRTLTDDDRAAIAAAYPSAALAAYGTITGHVTRGQTGGPLPGALVTAVRLEGAGAPVDSAASDYTAADGGYALRRLAPGDYSVRVTPLDGSIPGLVPEAINSVVAATAVTSFIAEWFSDPETDRDDPSLRASIAVGAGLTVTGVDVTTTVDTIPPVITSVLPGHGHGNVAIGGTVLVNFSEPIDANTIAAAFALRRQGSSGRVGGNGQLFDGGRTFVFTPSDPLDFGTWYDVVFGTQLTDREHVPLAQPFLSSFLTLPTPSVAIFDIQPRSAPAGAYITIRGQGLKEDDWDPIVHFGDTAVVIFGGSSTEQVVQVPPSARTGPVTIEMFQATSNAFNFTVLPSATQVPVPNGAPIALPFTPTDVAVSPEGLNVFAIGSAGFATINLSPARPAFRTPVVEPLRGAARLVLSPDGARAWVTRPDSGDVVEVDTDSSSATFGHVRGRIAVPDGAPDGICVTAGGARGHATDRYLDRVYDLDLDPTSATFRSVLGVRHVPGARLTGGIAHRVGDEVAVTTANLGLISFAPGDPDSTFATSTVDAGGANAVVDPSDTGVLYPGAGAREGVVIRGAASDNVTVTLGGRVRDVVVTPGGATALAVNSQFSQIQLVTGVTGALAAGGQVATGLMPVAIAVSSGGDVVAVANAGDRSIGLYSLGGDVPSLRVTPDAATPGEVVAMSMAVAPTVDPDSLAFSLGYARTAATFASHAGGGFVVPPGAQQRTTVSGVLGTSATTPLPLRVLDPITTLLPHATGIDDTPAPMIPGSGAGPDQAVHGLAISPDGRMLATTRAAGDFTATVRIDLYSLAADGTHVFASHIDSLAIASAGPLPTLAFAPDGRSLWCVPGSSQMFRVDTDPASPTFRQVTTFNMGFVLTGVAIDPLSSDVVNTFNEAGTPSGVYPGLNFQSGAHVYFPSSHPVSAVAWSRDGATVFAADDEKVWAFHPLTEALSQGLTPHPEAGAPRSVTVTGDDRFVVLWGNGRLGVYDEGANELWYGNPFPGGTDVRRLVPAPDGRGVIAGCGGSLLFRLGIDAAGVPSIDAPFDLGFVPQAMQRTPDGRQLWLSWHEPGSTAAHLTLYSLAPAASATLVLGAGQQAQPGATLPQPLRVHVADTQGRPQAGVPVRFALTGSGALQGSLSGLAGPIVWRLTDAAGEAEVAWTMPSIVSDSLAVDVTVAGVAMPVHVTAASVASDAIAAPVVTAMGPANGATGLSAATEVFVTFSQAMDPAGLAPKLRLEIDHTAVPGTLRLSEDAHTAFFRPASPLPFSAACVLQVAAGAPDAEGQLLATAAQSAFTVESEPLLSLALLSPPAAPAGAVVTLTGRGFSSVAAQNTVTFGTALGPVLGSTPTSMTVRVPATAASDAVTVRVGTTTSNGLPFVVLPPSPTGGVVSDSLPPRPGAFAAAVTPDRRRAYVVSPNTNNVGALDILSATTLAVIPVGVEPRAIAILPDGTRAYVANRGSGNVSVIGTAPDSANYNKVARTIAVGGGPLSIVVLGTGPQVLVLCPEDSVLRFIDAQRDHATFDQVTSAVKVGSGGTQVVVSPDGTRAFVANGEGYAVIELGSLVVSQVKTGSSGTSVTISPDGGLLFLLTLAGDLIVFDVARGSSSPNRVISQVKVGSGGSTVTVSPDGTQLFVSLADQNQVLVFTITTSVLGPGNSTTLPGDAVTLTPIATHDVGAGPAGIATDPFGDFVVVAEQVAGRAEVIALRAAPSSRVTYPNGGELLQVGDTVDLTWTAAGGAGLIAADLAISRDRGATWMAIADDVANTGHFAWTVPPPPTGSGLQPPELALLRVIAHDVAGRSTPDTSDAPFAIFDAATPALLSELVAEPGATGIAIAWTLGDPSLVTDVAVERAMAAAGPWARVAVTLATADGRTTATDAGAEAGTEYWYRVTATLAGGATTTFGPVRATAAVREFALAPVRPNPSAGAVEVRFDVAREAHVSLRVLDVTGREVARLADGVLPAGRHAVRWGGGDAPAGVYFVRYQAAGRTFDRRIVRVR